MCGIVGYIGKRESQDILIEGLKKLEYRGYDSAGIAVFHGKRLEVRSRTDASLIWRSKLAVSRFADRSASGIRAGQRTASRPM